MIKYLIPLVMLCVSVFGQSVSLHNFNTNQFTTNAHSLPLPTGQWLVNVNTNGVVTFGAINTNSINTNGYVLSVNTNVGSVVYTAITNLSGGPQVWTNDNNRIRPVQANLDVLSSNSFNVRNLGNSTYNSRLQEDDLLIYDGLGINFVDIYAVTNFSGKPEAVIGLTVDGVYGDGVLLDCNGDQGNPSPFSFSTGYSNSIASSGILFAIQNSHTNKWVLMGNGDLYWGADATVGYRPPVTNALPGQVLASLGNTPQTLYWTNLPAGFGGVTNFATTNTSAGLTNAIQSLITNSINQNARIGPGTLNQIAMFGPTTTNVTNSVMYQVGSSTIQMTNGTATDASVTTRFDLVGRYTDSTHFDELSQFWSVGQGDYEFGTDKGSAGSARQLTFIVGGTRYWDMSTAGHLLPITSGTTDIGAGSDGIRNLWVTGGRVLFDNTGVAGVGQIGYAGSPGSAINFQGQRIGFVDTFNAVDIVRIETGSVTPPSKTIVDIGACIIGAGSATGSRNSWFGQDPFNTGNRWVFGTNNTTQAQPAANQIMGSAASGNHSWGGDVQVIGGLSTGSGTNGSVILGTAEGGAAISTQNTPKIRTYLAPEPVTLTESTATLICTVSNITAAHFATVMVVASTFASDGTDHQSVGETFMVSCVNKAGTLTATVSASTPSSTTTSSGTLTTTFTAVANNNGFDLKNNAVSSLTQTKLNTRWRIESIDSDTTPFIFDAAGKHQ